MFENLIPLILENYGLLYHSISQVQSGYRNSSYKVILNNHDEINVLIYKAEADSLTTVKTANSLSDHLFASGLPVRRTLNPKILRLKSQSRTSYAVIYNYLPGQTIPWESYSKNHIKLTGMAMSRVHARAKDLTLDAKNQADVCLGLLGRMRKYLSEPAVQHAMAQKLKLCVPIAKLDYLEQSLEFGRHLPNQQPLHMDFVRGNLLFSPSTEMSSQLRVGNAIMSGIIDFEKAALSHPVFDVARTLAFLLVDCPRYPPAKIYKYFLQSGYNKRGESRFAVPITNGRNLLEDYISFFLLYDFYKFLRHNPYEFLPQNHHFIQTRDILLARNMVKYS